MEEWKAQQSRPGKIAAVPSASPAERAPKQSSLLSRVWSWFLSRYKLTSVKRLRLSETLPLGEKRFVALVSVEGREFLIGGGASGVSLLAQLGKSAESGKGFAANVEKASA
jgi:flagellar biogenesis protein FliO